MDTQQIDTTDILARPREYAAKLETMRAALEAVTAQLAAVTAERDAARAGWQDELLAHSVTNDLAISLSRKLDAARAEVERLTEARTHLAELSRDFLNDRNSFQAGLALRDETVRVLAAALRGDTAPAGGEAK